MINCMTAILEALALIKLTSQIALKVLLSENTAARDRSRLSNFCERIVDAVCNNR